MAQCLEWDSPLYMDFLNAQWKTVEITNGVSPKITAIHCLHYWLDHDKDHLRQIQRDPVKSLYPARMSCLWWRCWCLQEKTVDEKNLPNKQAEKNNKNQVMCSSLTPQAPITVECYPSWRCWGGYISGKSPPEGQCLGQGHQQKTWECPWHLCPPSDHQEFKAL